MKRFTTLLFTLLFGFGFGLVQAQKSSNVTEGTFPFHKKMAERANGLAIIIQGKPIDVEEVMERVFKEELQEGRLKSMKQGIMGMESARIARMSQRTLDYYYRVESTGGGEEGPTKVSLFLSAGNNNFLDSETFPNEMAAAKKMLQELQKKVEGYELELAIAAQEKKVKEAEKEQELYIKERDALLKHQESLVKEEENIIKKQAELATRLEEVKAEQVQVQQDVVEFADKQSSYVERITKEREALETLKAAKNGSVDIQSTSGNN